MTARVCDGTDARLYDAYGDPFCDCGAIFDDEVRSAEWPHARLPAPRRPTVDVPLPDWPVT